ncbi:hypothetical protein [Piscinibacter gummiphilus]|uniref:Uncharacterized protein n=1 Tax=Piscinibacter gummiphilus TaxID=946333 RepID=A0ABZ0CRQ7_9BURK|nr:hypothetical protein [Piscinibacter gummiphilus]WOB07672.1 hypothetical protein RXV79_22510 [Piscinibacter gummiphilus]
MQEDTRYAPPTATLRDPEAERLVTERPAQVRWASVLLWLSFTLGCALSVYELGTRGDTSEHAPAVDAVVAGITFGALALSAWLNVMIYRGHNWARIFYLVLTLVSLALLLVPGEEGAVLTLTEKIAYAVSSLLDVSAMVLVFTRPGALWFKRKR